MGAVKTMFFPFCHPSRRDGAPWARGAHWGHLMSCRRAQPMPPAAVGDGVSTLEE